jgi:AcrR family transcriptional regulator
MGKLSAFKTDTEALPGFQGSKVMVTALSSNRRTRKDAQHNRTHILEVARHVFTSAGAEMSMDGIAKQAGVGSGTLYRHFPNKDALLATLLDQHHAELQQQQATIEAEERDAGEALSRWINALGDWMLVYDGLSETLRAAWSRASSPLAPTCQTLIDATERILQAAQKQGVARQGLTGHDIFLGALAVAWAGGARTADPGTRCVLRDMLKNGWAADNA